MSQSLKAIRGMNDLLPQESFQWEVLESQLRTWLRQYGYREIRTPILERTELFCRAIGEVTDIVEKEMYTFIDSLNGESLTLRPEGTAACVRAVLEHHLLYNQAQRLFYIGPMFRHERPQKGRYRQFHQLGVEALGYATPEIDAELLMMTARLWRALGLEKSIRLEINTLGTKDCRLRHREALIQYLEKHQDVLDEDAKRRLYTNPLRILDTKNPALQSIVQNAPRLLDYLDEAAQLYFETVKQLLDQAGITYIVNPRLVRGLDYYNHTVFEWITEALGTQGTVCAGGRYDGLIEQMGGDKNAACGFAIGLERLLALLETEKYHFPTVQPDVYLVNAGNHPERVAYSLTVAETLRDWGLDVILHSGGGSFKSQFKKADQSQARYAVIIGDQECETKTVVLKALREEKPQEPHTLETLKSILIL